MHRFHLTLKAGFWHRQLRRGLLPLDPGNLAIDGNLIVNRLKIITYIASWFTNHSKGRAYALSPSFVTAKLL